jgi:hypothetical protein
VPPRALRFEPAAKPAAKDKFKAFGLSTKICFFCFLIYALILEKLFPQSPRIPLEMVAFH